ncbi:MAG TPA: DUF5668 domain-containing protein [Symbiobacteriaceae bacterium]|nr:DUF5668 domain-containing protein [Symbiobacteriaceae bacterium]
MEPNQFTPDPVPPTEPERPRYRGRSVVGPVILILLGLSFLANNLGIFEINVWEMMWKLWPVWLIAVGLDMMIGRRTSWGSWLVLGLVVTVIGGAVWLGNLGLAFGTYAGPAEAVTIGQDLNGAKRANVQINSSIGQLRLVASAGDNKLVEGVVYKLNGERLVEDASGSNGDVTYILKSQGVLVPGVHVGKGSTWDLKLAKNVAMDLKLGTGVGEARIDLTGLTLNSLDVHTGIGETEVILPATGNFRVDMENGIGQSTLRIPRGMGARIRATKGIGAVSVSGDFTKQDGYWVTPNFESAKDRVEVDINGGIGEIQIRN